MNANLPVGNVAWWSVAAWTMLHFLWLGALVGAAAIACRLALRRAAAELRYGVALVSLAMLAALPVGIAAWLVAKPAYHSLPLPSGEGRGDGAFGVAAENPSSAPLPSSQMIELNPRKPEATAVTDPAAPGPAGGSSGTRSSPIERRAVDPMLGGSNIPAANPRQSRGLFGEFTDTLESCVPYLPWLWLVGTPLTFALLATGVIGAERLRRGSRALDDGHIADALVRLRKSLGITRRVTVAVCERIAAPVLVGIVRPIILLPPAALSGWSPDEIEMVLLHELAHVRRWDNLVNLLQRVVESLLFFHPAVWLVSGWARREREACCDAIVVNCTQQPRAYAELLVAVASQISEPGRPRRRFFPAATSSAMTSGPLRARIRRILQLEDDPMLVSGRSLAVVLGGLVMVATLAVLYVPTMGQAEESQTAELNAEAAEDTESDGANAEAKTQANLKKLMLGLHKYHDSKGMFPANASYDSAGKPLLSWRVHLLPFLGEGKLYDEFHLDEPWDSKHNRQLIARMPDVFKNSKPEQPGKTNYLTVVGKECVFDGSPKGIGFVKISDGTAKTIALVEADANHAVEWTRPQDWKFDRKNPTAGLGRLWPGHWHGAWADGSVRAVDNSELADSVGIQFTRAGREQKSLRESEGRTPVEVGLAAAMDPAHSAAGLGDISAIVATRKFPSLEEQKLADLAYKRLGMEMEAIDDADLKRVQAVGYDGGLRVTATGSVGGPPQTGDILVGLHVWPTTSMKALADILNREDLHELVPLKFYVVSNEMSGGTSENPITSDFVRTGRISVNLDAGSGTGPRGFGGMRGGRGRTSSQPADAASDGSAAGQLLAEPASDVVKTFPVDAPPKDVIKATTEAMLEAGATGALQVEQVQQGDTTAVVVHAPSDSNRQAPPKANLRYDGKTFEEWRELWRNELSTERRLEAVKALAAFGRAGYGKEAAQAILDVAGEYDFYMIDRSAEGKLKQGVLDELAPHSHGRSLAEYWLPDLTSRLNEQPKKWKSLAYNLLVRLRTDDPAVITILESLAESGPVETRGVALGALVQSSIRLEGALRFEGKTRELLTAALKSGDPARIHTALPLLLYAPPTAGGGMQPNAQLVLQPELILLLFHEDEEIRKRARFTLQYIQEADAQAVVEALLDVLRDDERKSDHIHAVRALAAMFQHAKGAEEKLKVLLQTIPHGEENALWWATAVALQRIMMDEAGFNRLLSDLVGEVHENTAFRERLEAESQELISPAAQWSGGGGGFF